MSSLFLFILLTATSGQLVLNGSLFISNSMSEFQSARIYCDHNIHCTVNCYAQQACGDTKIHGPNNATLTINCNSEGLSSLPGYAEKGTACQSIDVFAENSTQLYINVYNEILSLSNAWIYLPTNNKTNNTIITCGIIGPYTSQSEEPSNTAFTICGYKNRIFSRHGFRSLIWTYYGTNEWALKLDADKYPPNRMYCGDDYTLWCYDFKVRNRMYSCLDKSSPCYSSLYVAQTDYPTEIPTIQPTQIPTMIPTDIPTKTPTMPPTEITESPTLRPTPSPTLSPTTAPTLVIIAENKNESNGNGLVYYILIPVICCVCVVISYYYRMRTKKSNQIKLSVEDKTELELNKMDIGTTKGNLCVDTDNNMNIVPSAPPAYDEDDVPPAYEAEPGANDNLVNNITANTDGENEGINELNHEQRAIKQWFENQVGFDNQLNETYFDLFIQNGFDKRSTIKHITDYELKEIGIDKLGHRKTILLAIQQL
eukprot:394012_1